MPVTPFYHCVIRIYKFFLFVNNNSINNYADFLLFDFIYKKRSSIELILLLSHSYERAGIRTPDNLIKSQVLYHLSYTPVPNALLRQMPRAGIEPATRGFSVLCSTD